VVLFFVCLVGLAVINSKPQEKPRPEARFAVGDHVTLATGDEVIVERVDTPPGADEARYRVRKGFGLKVKFDREGASLTDQSYYVFESFIEGKR